MSVTGLDVADLDDEERKAIAEVAKIGYYHGRPPNGSAPTPTRIDTTQLDSTGFMKQQVPERFEVEESTGGTHDSTSSGAVPSHGNPALSVANVLNARDLYVVLGASMGVGVVEMRDLYIQTIIAVHPMTNATASADEAFERATQAFLALGDLNSRWRYDMELQAGRGILKGDNPHVLKPLTPEESASTFIAAVKAAEQAGRKQAWIEQARELVAQIEAAPNVETIAKGLAMAAGMATLGVVAGAAGYPTVSTFACRGAMYAGVSNSAMAGMGAYRDPEFGKKLKSTAQTAGRNVGTGLASGLDQLCLASSYCVGASRHTIKALSDRVMQDAVEETEEATFDNTSALAAGDRVELTGLKTYAMNGRIAEVVSFNGERYKIRFLPDSTGSDVVEKLLKRDNLMPISNDIVPEPLRSEDAPRLEKDFI